MTEQPQAIYEVCLDLDGDLTFDDTNEDVSAYLVDVMTWRHGNSGAYDQMGRDSSAKFRLLNTTNLFSPSHTSGLSGLHRGIKARIRMIYPADQSGTYYGCDLGYSGLGPTDVMPLFDGASDYVNIYTSSFVSRFNGPAGTISVWLQVSASGIWTDGNDHRIVTLYASANNYVILEKTTTNNTLRLRYVAGGTTKTVDIGSVSSTDLIHLAITWDKNAGATGEMKAYISGAQSGATQTSLGTWSGTLTTTGCLIGAATTTPTTLWDGYICHVAMWDIALTSANILALYNNDERQRFQIFSTELDNLIGYWPLGEFTDSDGAVDESTTEVKFLGYVEDIEPIPDTHDVDQFTDISCIGWFTRVQDEEPLIEVQEEVTIDQVIHLLVDELAGVYPPVTEGWLLGVTGFSELNQTTILRNALSAVYTQLDTGQITLNYAGDTWTSSSIYGAIRELIETDGGWVYLAADGSLRYLNSDWPTTVAGHSAFCTYAQTQLVKPWKYSPGSSILNHIRAEYQVRVVGTSQVIGTHDTYISVSASDEREINLSYEVDGIAVGGKDLIVPVAYTDWTANANSSGTGADLTGNITVTIEEHSTSVTVKFANSGGSTAYILDLQVRGVPIWVTKQTYTTKDQASIDAYGKQPVTLKLTNITDSSIAISRADNLLADRKDAVDDLESITVNAVLSETLMRRVLHQTMGMHIALSEDQTGVDDSFYIMGEQHSVDGGCEHVAQYVTQIVRT